MLKDFVNKLEYLDYLIRSTRTGNPQELSKKMGLSKRAVHNYISLLKDLGAPIKYCRDRNSYVYEKDGTFQFTFQTKRTHA